MTTSPRPLRVAVIAGSLTAGGAEKQLSYQVRCLADAGVGVLLVSLDGPQHYGPALAPIVEQFVPVDPRMGRARRVAYVAHVTRRFAPDVVQATHTYANLYAWAAGRSSGAISIGALRSDLPTSIAANGWLSRWHFKMPDVLLSNCYCGAEALRDVLGRDPASIYVLDNAVDLAAMDREMKPAGELRRLAGAAGDDVVVLGVGKATAYKAFDRFARVIELARRQTPAVKGVIIGYGRDLEAVERFRDASPYLRDGLTVLGGRADAAPLMQGADVFFLSSENEGVPNALLEAMAARLACVTTPAGDAARIVTAASAGFVRDFRDEQGMAACLLDLAQSPARRRAFGESGRRYVERECDYRFLWPRMRRIYSEIAARSGRRTLADRFDALRGEV